MKKSFLLPSSIIIAAVIIGSFIYSAQYFKNKTLNMAQGTGKTLLQDESYVSEVITEQDKEIDDKLFFLNQECLKMKDSLSKEISNKTLLDGELSRNLEQLFYSPKTNSCLYVEYIKEIFGFYSKRLMDTMNDSFSSGALVICNAAYPSQELLSHYVDQDSGDYYAQDLDSYSYTEDSLDDQFENTTFINRFIPEEEWERYLENRERINNQAFYDKIISGCNNFDKQVEEFK